MNTFELKYPFQISEQPKQVVAMGFFDGVHLGHQKVIHDAKEIANKHKLPLAVLTYTPHPSEVFKNERNFKYLSSDVEKINKFKNLGVNNLYILKLTPDFSKIDLPLFVNEILMKLNPSTVVAGFDHVFGKNKDESNMQKLDSYSEKLFDVKIIAEEKRNNRKISSTGIRKLLKNGKVEKISELLGEDYSNSGLIVDGEKRGREIGFPTINVEIPKNQLFPSEGVYITETSIENDDNIYRSVTSIGTNETFEANRQLSVESFILDFNKNVYGKRVTTVWKEKIRNQKKFSTVDSLIDEIKNDVQKTKVFYGQTKSEKV